MSTEQRERIARECFAGTRGRGAWRDEFEGDWQKLSDYPQRQFRSIADRILAFLGERPAPGVEPLKLLIQDWRTGAGQQILSDGDESARTVALMRCAMDLEQTLARSAAPVQPEPQGLTVAQLDPRMGQKEGAPMSADRLTIKEVAKEIMRFLAPNPDRMPVLWEEMLGEVESLIARAIPQAGDTRSLEYFRGLAKELEDEVVELEAARWRSFDSAPTDGTTVLVWREDAGTFMAHHVDGEPDGDLYWFTTEGEDLTGDLPTLWMPVPEPLSGAAPVQSEPPTAVWIEDAGYTSGGYWRWPTAAPAEPVADKPKRITRNESTPETRAVWAKVDAAAERAPQRIREPQGLAGDAPQQEPVAWDIFWIDRHGKEKMVKSTRSAKEAEIFRALSVHRVVPLYRSPVTQAAPLSVKEAAETLFNAAEDWQLMYSEVEALVARAIPQAGEVERLRAAANKALSALDGLLGDSDLPEDDRPGVLAMQALVRALAPSGTPSTETDDGDK